MRRKGWVYERRKKYAEDQQPDSRASAEWMCDG